MLATPEDLIDKYRGNTDVSVYRSGEAHVIEFGRQNISVKVTVPDEVLEWFVDVHQSGQLVAQDWCDYCGYDQTPIEDLTRDMAEEVDQFLARLLATKLRVTQRDKTWIFGRKKSILESLDGGGWRQAVPFL